MAHEFESAKALRLHFKLSQTAAAADAGMAPNTFRVAEIDRNSVSPENQAKYDAFIARLRARLTQVAA